MLEPVRQNVLVPLALLHAYSRNYRQHSPEQVKKLKASLERFGQVRSIVCQEKANGTYVIVAGHGVVQASQELVDSDVSAYERFGSLRVDVIPASWNDIQVSGYLIADNQLATLATDDEDLLAELLKEQVDAGFTLRALGTDDEMLRQMLKTFEEEPPPVQFKEYDESIASHLNTELCEECGRLCVRNTSS